MYYQTAMRELRKPLDKEDLSALVALGSPAQIGSLKGSQAVRISELRCR